MNPLRILDPKRSLTATMWKIIAVAFVAWGLGFVIAGELMQRSRRPNYFQGYFCLFLPLIVFIVGTLIVNKSFDRPSSLKPSDLHSFLLVAIISAFAKYLPQGPRFMFAVMAAAGFAFIVTVARQWSKRTAAVSGSNASAIPTH